MADDAVDAVTGSDEQSRLAEVVERLEQRFPALDRRDVESVVTEMHGELADATVRDFVPVLVEKQARDRLQERVRSVPA